MGSRSPLRIVFAPAATGDAVFVDTGDRLYLIDCGAGLDYAGVVAALGHERLAGLVLTHAHADHWLALPDALALLAPGAKVARPGMTLAGDVLRAQPLFEYFHGDVDVDRLAALWEALPPCPLADVPGLPLWDVNAAESAPIVSLPAADWERVHRACITPALRWGPRVAVFGADLDASAWAELVPHLPAGIDLLQAPNHGGPPGRMARWVLDEHLRPAVVVVTDAGKFHDDHAAWYSGPTRKTYSLLDRKTVVATMDDQDMTVEVGTLTLPTIV